MPADRAVHALLAGRRSPRAFDPDKQISRADVELLLEAARWAPSCFNEQPWRFLVCERAVDRAAWEALLACLVPGNQRWATQVPLLIAALARLPSHEWSEKNFIACYDTGAASLNLCLQASAMGLAAHQMAGFDAARLRETFRVDATLQPIAVIAVGHPGDLSSLDEQTRARELSPRQRREIQAFTAFGRSAIPL